jgi:predicted nucleotidyltransferase
MVSAEIRRLIVSFVSALRAKRIRVEKVVLYGSHASGNPGADSDIDLAIISPDFGHNRLRERTMLLQLAWRIDPRLEPVAISSESYERDTWIPLIYEIREKGIEVEAA